MDDYPSHRNPDQAQTHGRSMWRSGVNRIFVGVAACGATALLFLSTHELPPALDPRPHEAAGWVMAQEALGRLRQGGRLIVITRDTTAFKHPASDAQFKSFQKAIRKARAAIDEVLLLGLDPLRPLEVPAGDFVQLIRKSPEGSVIVSFMGPPLLSEDQRRPLGEIRAKIVAFCPGALPEQIDLRVLFAARLLDLAVVSRRTPANRSAHPKGLQGWFDSYYQRVTSAEVERLYAPAAEPR